MDSVKNWISSKGEIFYLFQPNQTSVILAEPNDASFTLNLNLIPNIPITPYEEWSELGPLHHSIANTFDYIYLHVVNYKQYNNKRSIVIPGSNIQGYNPLYPGYKRSHVFTPNFKLIKPNDIYTAKVEKPGDPICILALELSQDETIKAILSMKSYWKLLHTELNLASQDLSWNNPFSYGLKLSNLQYFSHSLGMKTVPFNTNQLSQKLNENFNKKIFIRNCEHEVFNFHVSLIQHNCKYNYYRIGIYQWQNEFQIISNTLAPILKEWSNYTDEDLYNDIIRYPQKTKIPYAQITMHPAYIYATPNLFITATNGTHISTRKPLQSESEPQKQKKNNFDKFFF